MHWRNEGKGADFEVFYYFIYVESQRYIVYNTLMDTEFLCK